MAEITVKGHKCKTIGALPALGAKAPPFTLTKGDLSDVSLRDFHGKKVLLNIFPSLDTAVCALSVVHFNEVARQHPEVRVAHISMDLPFAMGRFCSSKDIGEALTLSAFRSSFGHDYGLTINDGPLKGLLSRAVIILDEEGNVFYTQLVPEISQEPDYRQALSVLGLVKTAPAKAPQ